MCSASTFPYRYPLLPELAPFPTGLSRKRSDATMNGVTVDDAGGDYLTHLAVTSCTNALGPYLGGAGAFGSASGSATAFSCTDGFDAVRAEEAYTPPGGSPATPHPPVYVALRCSTTGLWTSPPYGSGSGLSNNRTLTTVTCPATTAIQTLDFASNGGYITILRITCASATAPTASDTMDACPAVSGFSLLPGYTDPAATNTSTYTTFKMDAFSDCNVDSTCTAVAWGQNGGGLFSETQIADLVSLQVRRLSDLLSAASTLGVVMSPLLDTTCTPENLQCWHPCCRVLITGTKLPLPLASSGVAAGRTRRRRRRLLLGHVRGGTAGASAVLLRARHLRGRGAWRHGVNAGSHRGALRV